MKTTHGGWPVDEQAEKQKAAAKATHNAFYGKENKAAKSKALKKKADGGKRKCEMCGKPANKGGNVCQSCSNNYPL